MSSYELLNHFDLTKVEEFLDTLMPESSLSFGELVVEMMSGRMEGNLSLLSQSFRHACLYGFSEGRQLFVTLLMFGMFGAILNNAAGFLKGRQAMQLAQYFVILLASLSLFRGFHTATGICEETLEQTADFVRIFLPVFCLSLGFTYGTMTAFGYYQTVFCVIFILQQVLLRIFMPLSRCYLFLVFMNHLSNEHRFDGLLKLIEKGVGKGLKVMLSVMLGGGMLRCVMLVKVDAVQKTVLGKAISAVPIVGNMTDSAAQMLLACASLIKGSLGTAALVTLAALCLLPLLRLLFLSIILQLAAVFLGILGEKNMMQLVVQAQKSYSFLFQMAFCGLITFVLVIAMMLQMTA